MRISEEDFLRALELAHEMGWQKSGEGFNAEHGDRDPTFFWETTVKLLALIAGYQIGCPNDPEVSDGTT